MVVMMDILFHIFVSPLGGAATVTIDGQIANINISNINISNLQVWIYTVYCLWLCLIDNNMLFFNLVLFLIDQTLNVINAPPGSHADSILVGSVPTAPTTMTSASTTVGVNNSAVVVVPGGMCVRYNVTSSKMFSM